MANTWICMCLLEEVTAAGATRHLRRRLESETEAMPLLVIVVVVFLASFVVAVVVPKNTRFTIRDDENEQERQAETSYDARESAIQDAQPQSIGRTNSSHVSRSTGKTVVFARDSTSPAIPVEETVPANYDEYMEALERLGKLPSRVSSESDVTVEPMLPLSPSQVDAVWRETTGSEPRDPSAVYYHSGNSLVISDISPTLRDTSSNSSTEDAPWSHLRSRVRVLPEAHNRKLFPRSRMTLPAGMPPTLSHLSTVHRLQSMMLPVSHDARDTLGPLYSQRTFTNEVDDVGEYDQEYDGGNNATIFETSSAPASQDDRSPVSEGASPLSEHFSEDDETAILKCVLKAKARRMGKEGRCAGIQTLSESVGMPQSPHNAPLAISGNREGQPSRKMLLPLHSARKQLRAVRSDSRLQSPSQYGRESRRYGESGSRMQSPSQYGRESRRYGESGSRMQSPSQYGRESTGYRESGSRMQSPSQYGRESRRYGESGSRMQSPAQHSKESKRHRESGSRLASPSQCGRESIRTAESGARMQSPSTHGRGVVRSVSSATAAQEKLAWERANGSVLDASHSRSQSRSFKASAAHTRSVSQSRRQSGSCKEPNSQTHSASHSRRQSEKCRNSLADRPSQVNTRKDGSEISMNRMSPKALAASLAHAAWRKRKDGDMQKPYSPSKRHSRSRSKISSPTRSSPTMASPTMSSPTMYSPTISSFSPTISSSMLSPTSLLSPPYTMSPKRFVSAGPNNRRLLAGLGRQVLGKFGDLPLSPTSSVSSTLSARPSYSAH